MATVTTFQPDTFAATENRLWLSFEGNGQARFELREEMSAVLLELQIKAAMRSGDAITVDLKPEGVAQERKIILNPQSLPFVVLTYGD